jgi:hypothetical protein
MTATHKDAVARVEGLYEASTAGTTREIARQKGLLAAATRYGRPTEPHIAALKTLGVDTLGQTYVWHGVRATVVTAQTAAQALADVTEVAADPTALGLANAVTAGVTAGLASFDAGDVEGAEDNISRVAKNALALAAANGIIAAATTALATATTDLGLAIAAVQPGP